MKARLAAKHDMPDSREEELLVQMLVQGAGLAECRVAAPGVPLATLEDLQRRAPSAADPAPDDRPWTKKEDAALRSRIPRRTAEQIRRAALPWRTPSAIRMRARELGLSWGNIPSRPAAAPPLAVISPRWTADQDRTLCLLAGAVPFLVLHDRLAENGPAWSRQQIRERFNLLKGEGRIKLHRSLVFRSLSAGDKKMIVDSLNRRPSKRPSRAGIAARLPRGYTAAMLGRVAPDLAAPERLRLSPLEIPMKGRRARAAANAHFIAGLRFTYPTSLEHVRQVFKDQELSAAEWARYHGLSGKVAAAILSGRRRIGPGVCWEAAAKLGLVPAGLSDAEIHAMSLPYPQTGGQVRKALASRGVTVAHWGKVHGMPPLVAYRLLKTRIGPWHSRRRDLAAQMGLLQAADTNAACQPFPYPTTAKAVMSTLRARSVTIPVWSRANGLPEWAVREALDHGATERKGWVRSAAVKLGLIQDPAPQGA